jgi:bifunctional UDP-N-acetylglucosamine pyrophosphorylase / glucosamine-1-phosphate N-acetyltransferase
MSDTKVVILAAGKGTRMKADVPKPLVKIAGKPMLEHLVERVEAAEVNGKPVVVISPSNLDLFKAVLEDRVDYVLQAEQNGTGHALKVAREACGDVGHLLVLYGDHPFVPTEVIRKLSALASEHPQDLVMLTAEVPNFEGSYEAFVSWAKVLRDDEGEVIGLRERKDASMEEQTLRELNPGIYVFPAKWTWDNLELISNNNASGEYYLTDLVARAKDSGMKIVTDTVDALQVMGVNTPEELQRAEQAFLKNTE